MNDQDFKSIKDVLSESRPTKKPPAYQWQELALRIIKELSVPGFKRNAIFKACKENPKNIIEKALNDTKELCQTGEKWKYFFKVIGSK